MEYRKFATGEENVSLLGLGLMRLPKKAQDGEEIDYAEAQKIVDYAYEHGVTYYDTAYFYHGGDSEKFVSKALTKYPRDSYYLATKMPVSLLEKEEDMEKYFSTQLERTQAGYFDYYLCHALNEKNFATMERLGLYDFLLEKKAQGLIRHLGFSFHDEPEVLRKICAAHPWEFVQIQLNYLDWTLYRSREQYEIACEYNLPVIIMEPVRGGRLADLGPDANAILESAAPGKSVASWAMRYAGSFPEVLTVLSGMSNLEQVVDNVDTYTDFAPLNEAERKTLDEARVAHEKGATVPCTGCRYCVTCPMNIIIPEIFDTYNKSAFHGMDHFKRQYEKLPEESNGQHCVECGHCETMCPQNLPIPQLLHKLHAGEKPV